MTEMNSFEHLVSLLSKNEDIKSSSECLSSINGGRVIFHPGNNISRNHAIEVYSTRYDIQKKVTKTDVEGYEHLLKNLKEDNSQEIEIYSIVTDKAFYAIFSNFPSNRILGILKNSHKNISETLINLKKSKTNGYTVNNIIYDKKIRQPDEW